MRPALRSVLVSALNHTPARPFLAVRDRFDRRLQQGHEGATPPALLRLARVRQVPASITTFHPPGRPDVEMVNVESLATRAIFWMGLDYQGRHGAGPRLWEALCAQASEVVEVGANIGFFTLTGGAVARGTYTAYEPHPRSAAVLRANIERSGITDVQVREAAVVPDGGQPTIELVAPTGYDGGTPSSAMVRNSPLESILISERSSEVFRVDAVPVSQVLGNCDLLKLDIEGLEAELITAAWDRLVSLAPVIMVEVHDASSDLRALLPDLLAATDGTAYAMRRASLVPVEAGDFVAGGLMRAYGTWDYLVVPRVRAAVVDGLT